VAKRFLEDAAERSQIGVRARAARLRTTATTLVQCALATGAAWLVATEAVGHERPFFAPIGALLALGITLGQRGRRAVEMVLGVGLGIGVADALVLGIGSGTWQLMLVVLLAMTTAIVLGGGPVLVTQAGTSAVLVVVLEAPTDGFTLTRVVDALIGGGVALLVNSLVLPTDPVALVRRAAEPVLRELAGTLEDLAAALEEHDRDRAEQALLRSRAIDAHGHRFHEAIDVGRETTLVVPPRRRARGHLEDYARAAAQIDLAVRNVRVLARAVLRAFEYDDNVPPDIPIALHALADAVRDLGAVLADAPERQLEAREEAVRAAARATAVLEQTGNLSVNLIIGQIRSTAVDLLRGTGLELADAQRLVREAEIDAPES